MFFLRLNGGVNSIAGETIKGLNVVIGSDTTALTSALADVNKASRGIQTELRQVERLLRLDPSNVELVAQQQQLLTDAVANTSEKLNRLRAAQEQVNEQFARGEISAGQYRAFQREIAATEQQLSRFESQLSGTANELNNLGDAAENNADKLKDIGDKVKGAGEKMSMAITAPIVAAGGLMLKGAIDAENAQNKLQASLGITADAAADLEAVAQAVWVNGFGENIEEANASITTVRKNMGEFAEDEMQKVTEGALTIADIFEQDVNDVTVAAGVAMKNFGLEGQDALDLITVGFQKGGDYSGELLDSFREYAPQFASMGISADQAMGILIAGAEAGAWNLDKVGDSMKEFNIRAQDGSKATAEGFAAIGLDAEKMGESIAKGGEDGQKAFVATVSALAAMKNPMEQNIAGTALFGTQWEDVRSKVIVAMADGIKGIGDFKGATDEATAAMYDNNPGLAITKAMRELQLAIGPALLPLADIIQNTIVPAVKSMAEGFNNLSPAGQKTALAIAGIAAATGPLLIVLGSMSMAIGSLTGLFNGLSLSIFRTIAAKVTDAAQTMALIGLYIKDAIVKGASTAATVAMTVATTTWNAIATIATTVTTALGAAIAFLTSPIGIAVIAIAALIAAGVALYKNWDEVKAFGVKLKDALVNTFNSMAAGVSSIITKVKESIVNGITAALDWIVSLPDTVYGYGTDIIRGLINGIKSMAGEVARVVSGIVDGIKSRIKSALKISSPSKVMMEIGEFTGEGFIEGMKNTIAGISNQAEKLANAAIPDVSSITKGLSNASPLGNFTGSGTVLNVNVSNQGTLVGSNGMNEFANIMSRKIAGSFGLGTGGDF